MRSLTSSFLPPHRFPYSSFFLFSTPSSRQLLSNHTTNAATTTAATASTTATTTANATATTTATTTERPSTNPSTNSVARRSVSSGQSPHSFNHPSSRSPVRVLVSGVEDIVFNLALEQSLIQTGAVDVPTVMLWRNNKTVVIGRHQNPWRECNLQKMETEEVKLARRYTGGGAVYQDTGNTCFSFIHPGRDIKKDLNNHVILSALQNAYGIRGEPTGRNDLTIDGMKFSGSAYSQLATSCLHHGTILREVDLGGLSRCLTPELVEDLNHALKGVRYTPAKVAEALKCFKIGCKAEVPVEELTDWIEKTVREE
eukprot:GHVS01032357.1.p1 GENE.GHVS01032357.1~~GHVS01032357.1.p1  ORF type:complete len:346 (+),score=53.16 GHVS01032357.1:101-1039(+)